MVGSKRTGDLLVKAGLIQPTQLEEARRVQARQGGSLGRALKGSGALDETGVAVALARLLKLQCLTEPPAVLPPEVGGLLPVEFCRQRLAAPVALEGNTIRLAMVDPLDYATLQDAEFRSGKTAMVIVTTEPVIQSIVGQPAEPAKTREPQSFEVLASIQPAGEIESASMNEFDMVDAQALLQDTKLPPVVRLVNLILSEAAEAGASDVHIEPQESSVLVRRRVDGLLQDAMVIPKHLQDGATSRLKIMSGMDIADRRRPQDGRCRLKLAGRRIDMRVSTLPTQFGEKVVIRLLDNSRNTISLETLGFTEENLRALRSILTRPQGMMLVTGPTGSGKTSTLYGALNAIKSPTNNIVTVEDPIEAQVPGINQVQINTRAGVTFATGLRSILRQDPDVILVGEIRDQETANIAIEAAQTGHLLLSTLHTNDAASSITRLLDLGVEPFLITSSVIGILGQRLVRRVCPACARPETPDATMTEKLAASWAGQSGRWVKGAGCPQCAQSGYKGRLAIHELVVMTDDLRELIAARAPDHALKQAARRGGMRTMLEDGFQKAAESITTLEEVLRVAPLDSAPAAERASSAVLPPESVAVAAPAAGPSVPAAPEPFEVTLPKPIAPAQATPRERPRVLIVEDSPTIVSVVKYFLELEGFEVLVAHDGMGGLEAAVRERPDITVTDLNMPGMDGLALVKMLRNNPNTAGMALLMLTAETSVDREAEVLAAGADDYLAKPVEPKRLAARVRALLHRRRTTASNAVLAAK